MYSIQNPILPYIAHHEKSYQCGSQNPADIPHPHLTSLVFGTGVVRHWWRDFFIKLNRFLTSDDVLFGFGQTDVNCEVLFGPRCESEACFDVKNALARRNQTQTQKLKWVKYARKMVITEERCVLFAL